MRTEMLWVRRRSIVCGCGHVLALGLACNGGGAGESGDGDDGTASADDGSATMASTTPTGEDDATTGTGSVDDGPSTGATDNDDVDDTGTGEDGMPWGVSLEVDETVGTLLSVWGESVDTLYAVGGQSPEDGPPTVGAMFRYDGAAWTAADLPADTPTLNWVFGVRDRRVVVGDGGTVLWRDGDDGDWTAGDCATILPLWGVWGAAPDDLWTVGGDGFNKDPILCHFDGVAWARVDPPEPSIETHALFKIWGTSADHVFAVGDNGWILHFDGTQWVEQDSGTGSDLISLWGAGPDEIVAVGGRSNGTLARWDGSAWTALAFETVPGFNGVWMDPAGDAVVVGTFGTIGRVPAGTLDYVEDDSGTPLALHAVFGLTDAIEVGPLFAVGGSLDMPPPYVGIILAWPG